MRLLPIAVLLSIFSAGIVYSQRPQVRVAIVVFEGVQIIDFTGPYETFGQARYQVYTVSDNKEIVNTSMGLDIRADYTYEDAPEPDVIVLPGGRVPHSENKGDPKIKWVMENFNQADYLLTVCNGVFSLGPTGLLNGKPATTNAGMIDHMAMFIPGVEPVFDKRFVQTGKIISSGGLSAGIDGALHIISLINSEGHAQETANQMEYDWDPSGSYVRAQLADMELSMILDTNPPLNKETLVYKGGDDSWLAKYKIYRNVSLEEFEDEIKEMAHQRNWEVLEQANHFMKYAYSGNLGRWEVSFSFKKLRDKEFDFEIKLNKV